MLDIIFLVIVVVSIIVGMVRGFARECLSLLVWVVAITVTILYSRQFATLLPSDTIETGNARLALAALSLFVGCLLIGALINFLFIRLTHKQTMSFLNRGAGFFFGFLRGCAICSVLVLVGHLYPGMQQELWWRESRLLPSFDKVAESIHKALPGSLGDHFDFG